MVDTGLMRKNEFKSSFNIFKKKYKLNVKLINASKIFIKNLKGVINPEKKRKIIGNLFIKVFEKEAKKYKNIKYLAQGTLYPDIIESKEDFEYLLPDYPMVEDRPFGKHGIVRQGDSLRIRVRKRTYYLS